MKPSWEQAAEMRPRLVSRAMKRTFGNRSQAEDIVSEAYIRALPQVEDNQGLLAYLLQQVEWVAAYRKQKKIIDRSSVTFTDLGSDDPEHEGPSTWLSSEKHRCDWMRMQGSNPLRSVERLELREALQEAFESLSEAYKEVIKLYYFRDLEYSEIIERLDVSRGALKSRLFRARQGIRKSLESRGIGNGA